MTNNDQLLEQIRKVVREEVESEAKHTHTDITLLKMEVKGGMLKLEDRMKDLEISNSRIEKKQETLELSVEALRSENKTAHTEIMEKLTESNEIIGEQLKAQDKRLHTVEDILQVNKN
jgi:thiamine pyrophosphokinase